MYETPVVPKPWPSLTQTSWDRYYADHPAVAQIHLAAASLIETLGPMFWAALIVLFLWGQVAP